MSTHLFQNKKNLQKFKRGLLHNLSWDLFQKISWRFFRISSEDCSPKMKESSENFAYSVYIDFFSNVSRELFGNCFEKSLKRFSNDFFEDYSWNCFSRIFQKLLHGFIVRISPEFPQKLYRVALKTLHLKFSIDWSRSCFADSSDFFFLQCFLRGFL